MANLPAGMGELLRRDLETVAKDPFAPVDIRKIVGQKDLFRIRRGNYRLIYQKDKKAKALIALSADDRKDVY